MTEPDLWSRIHLALVQDDDPRVLVVLLLGSVFGIYARPLDLEHKQETGNWTSDLWKVLLWIFDPFYFSDVKWISLNERFMLSLVNSSDV